MKGEPVSGDVQAEGLEAIDRSDGADVVLIEFKHSMEQPSGFAPVPEWLRARVDRAAVIAANPHEGVALYCADCDLLLNGARTAGVCPVCGESKRERVVYFLAMLDEERVEASVTTGSEGSGARDD